MFLLFAHFLALKVAIPSFRSPRLIVTHFTSFLSVSYSQPPHCSKREEEEEGLSSELLQHKGFGRCIYRFMHTLGISIPCFFVLFLVPFRSISWLIAIHFTSSYDH